MLLPSRQPPANVPTQGSLVETIAVEGAPRVLEACPWSSPKKHPLFCPEIQLMGLIPKVTCGTASVVAYAPSVVVVLPERLL